MILGLVEGITEYLPISSTGHLLFTQRLLGISEEGKTKEAIDAYEIVIQAGAILAVLLLYAGRVRVMIDGLLGRNPVGRRLAFNVIAAFMPAAIIGFLLNKQIKAHLFGMWPIVFAWFVGGVVILLVTRRRQVTQGDSLGQALEKLTMPQSLGIGGLQCLAMWPGVSRSLVTILGGLAVGLSTVAAVEFSFLLGLVTLSAATVYEAKKHGAAIVHTFGWVSPSIGFIVACLSAMLAVKWLVGYLNKHGLAAFGYYRVALAIIVGGMLLLNLVAK